MTGLYIKKQKKNTLVLSFGKTNEQTVTCQEAWEILKNDEIRLSTRLLDGDKWQGWPVRTD